MLFNSYLFIFAFLPIALLGFFLLSRRSRRAAALWLALASLCFYGWWNPKFVLLLLTSVGFNYGMGYAIAQARAATRKHLLLVLAVAGNLLALGFFKYFNFFIATVNLASGSQHALLNIVLPVGISFFTFTQIAFLVDVYRGAAREYDAVHYLLFVSYFPHLVAGPILHHRQIVPQFEAPETYRFQLDNLCIGLTVFSIGLFKKLVLADEFALYADPAFTHAQTGGHLTVVDAWIGVLAYALQLYFDFSGYSDMAIGISRMFNVHLPLNFDSPYRSRSIIDFWRRWHMTLSAFLRDYLYIPLGGNRKGVARRYLFLMITMVLGGLWHGAYWTFIAWGLLHGIYLVLNHAWRALSVNRRPLQFLGHWLGLPLTFLLVVVAWVPFRAPTIGTARRMFESMLGLNGAVADSVPLLSTTSALVSVAVGLGIVWLLPNVQQWMKATGGSFALARGDVANRWAWRANVGFALLAGILFGLCLQSMQKPSPFLYFQF